MNAEPITQVFDDLDQCGETTEFVADVVTMAGQIIQDDEEKNNQGLDRCSDILGVDITSPINVLFAALRLAVKTIKALSQCEIKEVVLSQEESRALRPMSVIAILEEEYAHFVGQADVS